MENKKHKERLTSGLILIKSQSIAYGGLAFLFKGEEGKMKARIVLLVLVMLFISVISTNATTYEVIDLGAEGSNASNATAINNNGQVAVYTIGPTQAYLWDSINGLQELGYIGGDSSIAHTVSDNGKIAGLSSLAPSPPGGCPGGCPYHAFLYEDGIMLDLGSLGGKRSEAYTVNNKGQVVGWSDIAGDTHVHAFLYSDGIMQDLGNFGGKVSNSWAYGINNQGQIVGSAGGLSGGRHAFLHENGVMKDLGTLGGLWSEARDNSENGKIVGSSSVSGNTRSHAFLYEDGMMHDLGTLGGTESHAYAVNNKGQVVGVSRLSGDTVSHAFLYEDDFIFDLNELINNPQWVLTTANDINESGQIVGRGNVDLDGDGSYDESHAFLLIPIVEDSDGDGIADDEDACPFSDLNENIVIDGWNSGVENVLLEDGCTILDLISQCADEAENHGEFVSSVSSVTNTLKKKGVITGKKKGMIQKCAAKADIP